MNYSKLALLLALSAVLPCSADDIKPADVPIPNQVTHTSNEKPYISLRIDDRVPVVELLKVIDKSFNFKSQLSIDENVGGLLNMEDAMLTGMNWVMALDQVARKASLSITINDEGKIEATQLPKGQFKTIVPQPAKVGSGFQLKLILDKMHFLPGERIETSFQLEREAGQPNVNVMWGWGMKNTLQLTMISLSDHALVSEKSGPFNPMSNLDARAGSRDEPIQLNVGLPLRLANYQFLRLKHPLKPGRYLYFATYRSQPKGATFQGQPVWEGEVNSNVVEFEVLPAPKIVQ